MTNPKNLPTIFFIRYERAILLVFCHPTVVGGRRPLQPKMDDRSDPPLQKSLTSTDFSLTNALFTGLRFEVEKASRGLSAAAELLVVQGILYRVRCFDSVKVRSHRTRCVAMRCVVLSRGNASGANTQLIQCVRLLRGTGVI